MSQSARANAASHASDLAAYTGKGFPGTLDQAIADCPVAEPDLSQTQGMVRLCDATRDVLYEGGYSPTAVRYTPGTRPRLEAIVEGFSGSDADRVEQARQWVADHVVHPHFVGPLRPDRGMTEEQLIDSGTGWCNEQSRVFILLCEVMGIPARLCFVFHANLRSGHTCTEVYLDGRWAFCDVTFGVMIRLPDGRWATGGDLSGPHRDLAHAAYRPAFEDAYARTLPYVENEPGWCSADRPTVERGGDMLEFIGICNYLGLGIESKS